MATIALRCAAMFAAAAAYVTVAAGPAAAQWREINIQEGGFAVSFPGAPKLQRSTTGSGLPLMIYRLNHTPFSFQARYQKNGPRWTEPGFANRVFTAIRSALVNRQGFSLLSERRISLGPAVGRELSLNVKRPNATVRVTIRAYLLKDRFFQVVAGGPAGREDDPVVSRFLGSVRLTRE